MKNLNFYILSGFISSALLVGGFGILQAHNIADHTQMQIAQSTPNTQTPPKKKLTQAKR